MFDLQVGLGSKVIKAPRVMAFLVTLETQGQMVSGWQKYKFPCRPLVKQKHFVSPPQACRDVLEEHLTVSQGSLARGAM